MISNIKLREGLNQFYWCLPSLSASAEAQHLVSCLVLVASYELFHLNITGGEDRYAINPHFKHLNLFYEYFHGDTGRGCGAR